MDEGMIKLIVAYWHIPVVLIYFIAEFVAHRFGKYLLEAPHSPSSPSLNSPEYEGAVICGFVAAIVPCAGTIALVVLTWLLIRYLVKNLVRKLKLLVSCREMGLVV